MDEMTLPEAAELLGVHRTRVWQYVRDGVLTGRKVGRDYVVKRDEVLKIKECPPRRGRPPRPTPVEGGSGQSSAERPS
jgi:excisionase family DNA binding protein